MHKAERTKALYAGSFDPVTRGHLDIIRKALVTFDAVHVAIGTNVRKQRAFSIEDSLRLIKQSVCELWPRADALFENTLEVGEYANQSLIKYARAIAATHIVRGLREATNFNEEFNLHGLAERIDPSIPMVHFTGDAQFLHVSSSTAKELTLRGSDIGYLASALRGNGIQGQTGPDLGDALTKPKRNQGARWIAGPADYSPSSLIGLRHALATNKKSAPGQSF